MPLQTEMYLMMNFDAVFADDLCRNPAAGHRLWFPKTLPVLPHLGRNCTTERDSKVDYLDANRFVQFIHEIHKSSLPLNGHRLQHASRKNQILSIRKIKEQMNQVLSIMRHSHCDSVFPKTFNVRKHFLKAVNEYRFSIARNFDPFRPHTIALNVADCD